MSNKRIKWLVLGLSATMALWGCGAPAGGSQAVSSSAGSAASSSASGSIQETSSKVQQQEEGEVMTDNIKVYGQNSIRITMGDKKIYIDPFQMKEAPNDADFLFITHEHSDHYSPADMKKVAGKNTILIMPESMQGKVAEAKGIVSRIETVKPSETKTVEGLEFTTVPAYNINKQFHPKSNGWVGYILNVNGTKIYIAGDMDATDEAKAVKCDVALVPVGGTYTMTAPEAAELINIMQPKVAIPVHYGSVVGSAADAKTFKEKVKAPIKVEIPF